jgi:anti-sigma factor RsiW
MPITDSKRPGAPRRAELGRGRLAQDEDLAVKASAYLDGELAGEDLARFEALLLSDEALSLEVAGMQRIGQQLTRLGAGMLNEPIPGALLEPLARLKSER